MTYQEQIKDPRWQKKRLEILSRDEFTCHECGDTESTLHVHHLFYDFGKMIWEADDRHLITLCSSCHAAETEMSKDYISDLKREMANGKMLCADIASVVMFFNTFSELLNYPPFFDIIEFALKNHREEVENWYWESIKRDK
jgi:hypothetical protein